MAIGFKHGTSGGDQLGITVVSSGTKPTAPKENTIWVDNTNDHTMGSWAISMKEPHRLSGSRNLIVYPYMNSTKTVSGITFAVDDSADDKGIITLNGTNSSSGTIVFRLSNTGIENRELLLQPGTYYLSGNCASSSASTHRLLLAYTYDNWGTSTTVNELNDGGKFTLNKVARARVSIQVSGGVTVANAVYKPMLEKGSKGTGYVMGDATGQVWIKTDPYAPVFMRSKKSDGIYVYPKHAYIYTIDNGWVKHDAEVYQKAGWIAIGSLDIYAKGNSTGYSFKCNEKMYQLSSNGWPAAADRVSIGSANITVTTDIRTYDFTNIFVTNDSGDLVKVDLSEYNSIRIKGTLSGASTNTACVFRVLSEMGAYATENNVVSKSFTSGTIDATIDISAVDSECYLGFTFYNETATGTIIGFKLTEMWLE